MNHLFGRQAASWAKPSLAVFLGLALSASSGLAIVTATTSGDAASAAAAQAAAPVPAMAVAAAVSTTALTSGTIADSASLVQAAPLTAPALEARVQPVVQPRTVAIASTAKTVSKPKAPVRVAATRPKAATVSKPRTTTVSYHGIYHLWIPGLGLNRDIDDWGCRGGLIPNHVERWGCAGRNNVYLLGHAWGVFAPIHNGYHSGALHVGLTAYYADKSGNVHRYRVSAIRHVRNADYASWSGWATGAYGSPVITLQTCDGSTSAYRILVRLVPA